MRQAAETVARAPLSGFFEKYVPVTEEIPWDDFLRGIGFRVVQQVLKMPDLGFSVERSFGMVPTVNRVIPGSEAERQGLEVGDVLVEINGHPAGADYASQLAVLQPGDAIRLLVRSPRGVRR